jgi:hypothetical protein
MRAGRIALALAFAAAGAVGQDIASLERWTVDSAGYAAHNTTIRRGETRILEPTFTGYDLTPATNVVLRYRAAGMTNYWPIAGEVYAATSGTVRVRWTPEHASTQTVYSYEIAVQSSNAINLRAFGQITLQPGIGSSGSALPAPGTADFDWSGITNAAPIAAGDISSVDAWTVDPSDYAARAIQIRSGETRILQVTHSGLDLSAATAVALRYRSTGMTNYYQAAGEITTATAGVVRIKWTPANEGTAKAYSYEIAVLSSNAALVRAFGDITIFQGLGQLPATTPQVGTPVDWAAITEHRNLASAPFPTFAWVQTYVSTNGGSGTQGPPGTNGVDGVNGTNGAAGPQGPIGPAGTNGTDGAAGPAGPQGPAGTNGVNGTNGVDGATGPQGPPGTNGVDGAQGPQGPQGIPGTNGLDGAQGPAGPAGTNGTNGAVGPQGPAGTNGIDGATYLALVTPYTIPSASTVTVTSVMVTNFPQGEAALWPTNTFLTFGFTETNAAGIFAVSCYGTNGLTIDSNACYGAAAVISAWTNSATLPNEILIRKQSGDPKPHIRLTGQ